jgi:hypothetical protein
LQGANGQAWLRFPGQQIIVALVAYLVAWMLAAIV